MGTGLGTQCLRHVAFQAALLSIDRTQPGPQSQTAAPLSFLGAFRAGTDSKGNNQSGRIAHSQTNRSFADESLIRKRIAHSQTNRSFGVAPRMPAAWVQPRQSDGPRPSGGAVSRIILLRLPTPRLPTLDLFPSPRPPFADERGLGGMRLLPSHNTPVTLA